MIIPGWLTVHVVGYGLAAVGVVGAGAYALSQHDAKIHAEEQAKAAYDRDTLRTRLLEAAVDAKGKQVDTVVVATRNIIQPTKVLIDSAIKHVHDTVLVQTTLAKADTAIKACSLLAQTCDEFRKMATDSLRVMGILLRQSDQRALNVLAPPPERRLSVGISTGVGYCAPLVPPYSGKPCVAVIIAGQLRIF